MKYSRKLLLIVMVLIMMLTITSCKKTETTVEDKTMDLTEETNTEDKVADKDEEVSIESLVGSYFADKPDHSYLIAQDEMVQRVVDESDMVVLDIRQAKDYDAGHLKGAINVPWGPAIAENLNKIPQDKEVFIYCYSGQTAGQAVATLNFAGINARSVKYGWNFGLSKVDGVDAVTETTVNELGSDTFEVAENVQKVLTEYYVGLADVKGTTYGNYKISEDNLKIMIEEDKDFYLISARKAEDFAKAHIAGANNIPYGKGFIEGLYNVPKDKKVVVYCYSGQTAGQAVAAMKLIGYDAVSLNGGMGTPGNDPLGWANKGYTVVSSSSVYNGVVDYFANKPDHSYLMAQDEMAQRVVDGDDMVVLDIRQAKDYDAGHLKGAVNIPWGPAIAENLDKIPQDKEVFIYCYSGQTAGQAVMTLNLAGINARSVKYGWNFGLSKVDGIDAVTETVANTLEGSYTIDAEIQTALNEYYAGLADVKGTTYGNYKISEDSLSTMIDMEEDFYLLSARRGEDFEKGHIVGANNVPYGKDFINGLGSTPKDKKVVVYCYSGQTSGQAVAAMKLIGYDAVSLNGGVGTAGNDPLGWGNKGYELVTE